MKLCHFALDRRGQLRRVRPKHVAAVLRGRAPVSALGCPGVRDLALVTVACDAALLPRAVYLLRAPLTGGWFTDADERVLRALASPARVTPHEAATHHGSGWPRDLVRQLAVALDVPIVGMQVPFGAGGPLLVAVVDRVTIREAARRSRPF